MALSLTIDRCPHGVYAVGLDDDAAGKGTRLTPTKCCGRWERLAAWPMNEDALSTMAGLLLDEIPDE